MTYEPNYERFEVVGPDGERRKSNSSVQGFWRRGTGPNCSSFE